MQETMHTDPGKLAGVYEELEAATRSLLQEQEVSDADITVTREAGMCYVGQSYQLQVSLPDTIDDHTAARLAEAFHSRHAETYGFDNEQEPTQIVNLRVVGIGAVDRPVLQQLDDATDSASRAIKGKRQVYFSESNGLIDVDLYDREKLVAGDTFSGPAIVEQMDTTIVVSPDTRVVVEKSGNLIIHIDHN